MRTRVGEVSSLGRNTQGVTLIKLASDEKLVGLERVQEPSLVEGEELEGEEVVDGLVAGVIDADVEDAGEDLQADAAADDDEPQN
ncbi:DNA gyrase subunit A [Pseudomonas coronafaciens pv. garcae]|nr:DNA gyrase subunit A [Pseudomonas coronafaciens pv. garcae]RMV85397.1 DNA gyrase subunit A [Pseudomonas coronafaciens pv. garcae]